MRTPDSQVIPRQEGERKTVLLRALQAIDSLQSRLQTIESERTEAIAIVGLACRFPGAQDPEAFWEILSGGIDAVTEVPDDRWDKDAYDDQDPSISAKIRALRGGFLRQVDLFDPAFFGISGREAQSMDPQQRLLLEISWEALENAGIAPSRLRGSSTGVFVGITTSDYARLGMLSDSSELDFYSATGSALNVAAGRISFVMGLNGPAMAVDTACSSSLVALHLACQSLHHRECDLALAGGVNMLLTPEPFVCLAKWGMVAEDGRCKTFDELADGYVRSEGCGMVALKRHSDALAAGDRILALIRGTAVNQDGASSGLTVPNGLAQQAVVRAAIKAAGLEPRDLDYLEAHGTGTAVGDPIELEALIAVLGKDRSADQPLRVGSVKTNIGHLESASGIAGLIKVVLSMENEEMPGLLHFHKLNPRISLDGVPIEIPVTRVAWPRTERPRIAGVNSFGFSGTNAHVILQEAPPAKESAPVPQPERSTHLLVLSASSENALREVSASYAECLTKEPESSLADICHTAAVGRSALSHRLAFPARDIAEAKEFLSTFAQGKSKPEISSGRARSDSRVAFLFTGQGAQYPGMGRELYEAEPAFREAFDQCANLLGKHLDQPLQEIVGYDSEHPAVAGALDETGYTQPALFAVEYALASLWRSWGIEPAAIVGHSLGEYVGACVAGVLSLKDALRLVATRSRLMQSMPRNGAMAAVFAGEDRVRAAIAPYSHSVSIAATNSPLNTVISGAADDVRAVLERLRQEGVAAKPLTVSHAFHSPLVEPMLDEFEQLARGVEYRVPAVDLVLNATGRPLDEQVPMDASYWRRHARGTVRFAESIQALHARGIRTFLEIGPAPALIGMARQCLEDPKATWLSSLRKDRDAWPQMLSSLGTLFVLGAQPDWGAYDRPYRRRRVALPTYPFQRERHWFPVASADSARKRTGAVGHPLLGMHVPLAGRPGEHVWFGELSLERCPWMDDHRVQGVTVVPAAAYVEMAIAAAVEAVSELPVVLRRIEIENALVLKPAIEFEIQTRLEQEVAGIMVFQVHSRRKNMKGDWTLHASGALQVAGIAIPMANFDAARRDAFAEHSTRCLDSSEFYRLHKERGNQWGPCFQTVSRVWQGQGEALSEFTVPAGIERDLFHFLFHPALADTSWQTLAATNPLEESDENLGGCFVGSGIDEVRIYRRPEGKRFYAYARSRSIEAPPNDTLVGDIQLFDSSGNLIAEILGTRLWYLDSFQKQEVLESVEDWLYEPQWLLKETTHESSPEAPVTGTWVIFRDQQGVGKALCAQLRERGVTCLCVDHGEQRSQANDGGMTIRADNPEDYDGLLHSVTAKGSSVDKIVHLWSLDSADPDMADLGAVQEAQTRGPVSILRMVQALDRTRQPAPPKLWLVSRGAQPVGEKAAALSILQSPLWGLGRTIAMESGDLWGGQVDLDPADNPETAAALLLRQILEPQDEDQTAFRDGRRHVLRLARQTITIRKPKRIPVYPDATYLITGGLGGIGLVMAGWLASRGARHLILAGRSALPAREQWDEIAGETTEGDRIKAIRALESLGVNVQTVAADMGNEKSVTGLIRLCLRADQPPLRGVFHAAGVMQYEPLSNHTPERMRDVLGSKMVGGWLLHRLLADVPLDLFVLFSSSSSLLSSPMMGSYSAANGFLDALAHHRRATGKPAISINWGTWSETGMALRFQPREVKRNGRTGANTGVGVLPTRHGLKGLERVLEDDAVQAGVMPMDWERWERSYGNLAVAPYLSLLISESQSRAPRKPSDSECRERVLAAQPEARGEIVSDYLAKQMARILKVSLASVDTEKPISNMGFDSLMAIELKNQIELDLGVSIAMARLIQGPALVEMTDWVTELLAEAPSAEAAATVMAPVNEYEEGVL